MSNVLHFDPQARALAQEKSRANTYKAMLEDTLDFLRRIQVGEERVDNVKIQADAIDQVLTKDGKTG